MLAQSQPETRFVPVSSGQQPNVQPLLGAELFQLLLAVFDAVARQNVGHQLTGQRGKQAQFVSCEMKLLSYIPVAIESVNEVQVFVNKYH